MKTPLSIAAAGLILLFASAPSLITSTAQGAAARSNALEGGTTHIMLSETTPPRRDAKRRTVRPRAIAKPRASGRAKVTRSKIKAGRISKVAKATETPKPIELAKTHRLAVQVTANDPAAMTLALNNVSNAVEHYRALGQPLEVEVVAYGPGLHMLRDDTSPVKERLHLMSTSMKNVTFKGCGNTQSNMQKAEGKSIPIVAEASVVPSGVVRLIELQEGGWSYLRP